MDRVKARQPGGNKELKTVFSDVQLCLGEISESPAGCLRSPVTRREERPCDRQLDPRAAYAATPRFADPFPEVIDGAEGTGLLEGTGSNRAVAF